MVIGYFFIGTRRQLLYIDVLVSEKYMIFKLFDVDVPSV